MSIDSSAEARSIRGKRASVKLPAMREKARRGRFTSDDRALVRVGNMSTRILIGMEDLTEWDDEELKRGRRRDKNGGWQGRDPVVVPKAIHDEITRRTMEEAGRLLRDNLNAAVVVLTELVVDSKVDAKDRLKAVEMIMNRVMGKEPQKLEMTGNAKWQIALADSIVSMEPFTELEDATASNRDTE